jgi:hypothetical protein
MAWGQLQKSFLEMLNPRTGSGSGPAGGGEPPKD